MTSATPTSATTTLYTERLELAPITLPLVEAVLAGDRAGAESLAGASIPVHWSGRDLVTRAFSASIEEIRADPARRLWGDRLMISRSAPRCVQGSVIFRGKPGPDGVAEVAYGVEAEWQGQGLATEAVRACLDWALRQPEVWGVQATTFALHHGSIRVMLKVGMQFLETREHDTLGELLVYEIRRPGSS